MRPPLPPSPSWTNTPKPSPERVVLRAANSNQSIASGNCSTVYRWPGEPDEVVIVFDKTHVVANPSLEICHCEPVRTLVWPFPRIPSGHNPFSYHVDYSDISGNADCHTSDIGHWFAMTAKETLNRTPKGGQSWLPLFRSPLTRTNRPVPSPRFLSLLEKSVFQRRTFAFPCLTLAATRAIIRLT